MSKEIHFRSQFFAKDAVREKEDWLNEHFAKGYVIVELKEIESGYFAHLVSDPRTGVFTRIRFFARGLEKQMDDWITSKFINGWSHDVHPSTDGYWVIIYREDEEKLPPLRFLILNQFIELWWLWLIGTIVFGLLWYNSS
ncbi:hypothetical protein ACFO25_09095 [Paenactinomyces guangxiensis]|uniref:Uncharacterized protein n=1 Tax=Paenactinomyces guangxiensis TaxID=1490290 RepID=A0A7W2A763_9BACL|nr:hypothetical protein [Paenactinomyces guangxiensis]MBA4492797.1 hypothetical protein [Paenactinomyces guangxiensis]MBH8590354.1 hypothetical protein [Paenactinomyces guangxiensis]